MRAVAKPCPSFDVDHIWDAWNSSIVRQHGRKFYNIRPATLAPKSFPCQHAKNAKQLHQTRPCMYKSISQGLTSLKVAHCSCTSDLTIWQAIILSLQSSKSFLSVFSQVRFPVGSHSVSKEPWLPLFHLLFPLSGLVALPFFDLLLELGRFRVLFALYCTCHASPETLGFVWKLLVDRGDDFGGREQGSEVQ